MNQVELMANLMLQVRVNEAAICLLANKVGLDPVEIFDESSSTVDRLIAEEGFNATS